ncbi:glycosyltransferase family 4 protein [Blastococcus sp. SYSU D00695]
MAPSLTYLQRLTALRRNRTGAGSPSTGRARPHVLVILENLPLGNDIRVRKEVDDLLAAGYRVSVICQSGWKNDELRTLPGLTLWEYPAPVEPRGLVGYVREYAVSLAWAAVLSARVRRRGTVDVLQLIQPPDTYPLLAWAHKRLGAAVLVDQHDLMPELFDLRGDRGGRPVRALLGRLERWTQRVADETVCTNEYQRARLLAAGGTPDRVTVVRNGPVLDRVRVAEPDEALRAGHRQLCCWIGKMGRQDRVDLAVRAVHHAVELGAGDVQFVFLGDGECLDEARELAAQLGLDHCVSFPGWVPEATVFAHLATADLGLDASLQADVSPIKVYEYMAFGVPFVSFDLGETRAVGGEAGSYVPPGDAEALGRELAAVLADPDRRRCMGRVGRDRVRDELAWEHQGRRYLEVVARLCARPPGRLRGA